MKTHRILITGSGTLAKELTRQLTDQASKIAIYSRDEAKHAAMQVWAPEGPPSPMRYRIGDIRDLPRLTEAMRDVDMVIHTAALKRIDTCANNVQECVSTNVIGTQNVIKACLAAGVKRAVFISTDKAVNPLPGAYGISKLMAEQLWTQANMFQSTGFVALRYGNVWASNGSVGEIWARQANAGEPVTVTDDVMTRFFWSIQEAAAMTVSILMAGGDRGCMYIPKMKSWRMADIARLYSNNLSISGCRTAEKTHEELITEYEMQYTRDLGDRYVIYPMWHQWARDIELLGTVPGITEYTSATVTDEEFPYVDR